MKHISGFTLSIAATSFIAVGVYAAAAAWMPAGETRIALIDIFLCIVPLFVNGALLLNAITPDWRKNAFWMLLALGCSLWLAGQSMWTYVEVYQHQHVPIPFLGDIVFFLHIVPMIAALTIQPHQRPDQRRTLYGYVDFWLMVCWWVYLYVIIVIPWQYIVIDSRRYTQAFNLVSVLESFMFVGGAAMLSIQAPPYWRRIYAQLAGAGFAYAVGRLMLRDSMDGKSYSRDIISTVPLVISLLWLGIVGIIAYRTRGEESTSEASPADRPVIGQSAVEDPADELISVSRAARVALLSLPVIGLWYLKVSHAPTVVSEFRMIVTLGAVLPLGFLVFLRHELMDADRLRLLRDSQESLDNLKRLQTQFVQSEKLASIGQLVAGAAHEINNPLTAILGYSELLADDASIGDRPRKLAEKIREQARRTKTLVNNLLSFARQVPSEKRSSVDVNTIVNTAVQFRRVDLRAKNIRIEVQTDTAIPEVRGDANHLLQVFSNIINNAADAMQELGGGALTVRTQAEKGNIIILFSDTGPGIRNPLLVFDPFYTTKPVGKGTGLGLSICYGLIHDQGGQISCYNRPEGGATFRIELPAVAVAFPLPPRSVGPASRQPPAKLA